MAAEAAAEAGPTPPRGPVRRHRFPPALPLSQAPRPLVPAG